MTHEFEQQRVRQAQLANLRQELLAPVTAIVGYGEMLHEEASDSGLHEMLPDLGRIVSAAQDLLNMVDQLLHADQAQRLFESEEIETVQTNLRHDLRTPMNGIIGYGEMLLEDLDDLGGARLRVNLEKLLSVTNDLLATLEDIVDFSRGEVFGQADSGGESASMVAKVLESIRPVGEQSTPIEETGHILVVDDIEANRDVLARRLARDGHCVAMAEGGAEALSMMATELL